MIAAMVPVVAEQAMADIKFPSDSKWENHQYEIYQIYVGDVDSDNTQGLLNIKYGRNHATGTEGDAVAQTEIEALVDIVANARGTNDLGDLLATGGYVNLNSTPFATLTKDTTGKKVNVPTGYYLIKDKDGTVPTAEAYTLYIMEVLQGEFQITPKASVPSDEKKVADINDSTQTTPDAYSDSADYDIGDNVPFQLKATTADNVSSYYQYHITFHDKQSAGLDAPESFTVTVLGKTFTVTAAGVVSPVSATTDNGTIITVTKPAAATGETFAIRVDFESTAHANKAADGDLTAAMALNAEVNSTDILVNYTARLNEDAVIGGEGNKNESHIDYSNNPNDEDGGDEGHTPDKPSIVFTYKFMMDKVDQDYEGLTGAGFVLLKEVATGTATVTATEQADLKDVTAGTIVSYNSKTYVVAKNWGVQEQSYNFNFEGIDDGNYLIVETHVPTGYNQAADVPFTVTATHTKDGITTLTVTGIQGNKDGGSFEFGTGDKKDTIDAGTEAAAATAIINQSGTQLPETGGIGTTIFYVAGGILVLAAVILLVTKRRMNAND